jgi:hypothetical protein
MAWLVRQLLQHLLVQRSLPRTHMANPVEQLLEHRVPPRSGMAASPDQWYKCHPALQC